MYTKEEKAHEGTINYLSTYRFDNELYVITMCSDGKMTMWFGELNDEHNKYHFKSELLFGRNLQEVSAIQCIGKEHLLVLVGGYDSKVHIYTIKRGSNKDDFSFHFSLLGHKNSIKDLAISPILNQ
jgi:WD40 repeat protein